MSKNEIFYSVDELVARPNPKRVMSPAELHHLELQKPTQAEIARAEGEGMVQRSVTR